MHHDRWGATSPQDAPRFPCARCHCWSTRRGARPRQARGMLGCGEGRRRASFFVPVASGGRSVRTAWCPTRALSQRTTDWLCVGRAAREKRTKVRFCRVSREEKGPLPDKPGPSTQEKQGKNALQRANGAVFTEGWQKRRARGSRGARGARGENAVRVVERPVALRWFGRPR